MRYVFPILLAVASCSCSTSQRAMPVASRLTDPGTPVIARIATRHQTIVVRSGPSGPTYSLETSAGEVLIGDMTLDQLAQKTPEMFRMVKSMQDGLLWAGTE